MVMHERPDDLPDFGDPPLDEVAIAVQFRELSQLLSVHYGLLFDELKSDFPHFEEHQPLSTRFETFGRSVDSNPQFAVSARPPLRRIWYVSDDGHQLIQVQPDRFVHNWRKVGGEGTYPRFESIIPNFSRLLKKFDEFLSRFDLGSIQINQCELSYFNILRKSDRESYSEAFDRIFCNWNNVYINNELNLSKLQFEAPSFSIALRVLSMENNEPVGRLHINASSASNTDTGEEVIRLSLVFRGPLPSDDIEEIEKLLFLGREAIVQMFASITSDECHVAWDRKV